MSFGAIKVMVEDAERHADDLASDRVDAIQYYKGEMRDTPSEEGRSSLTTREVRSYIRKVLPSVERTILGNDEVVEYQPKSKEDEAAAQQASDYINFVVMAECSARDAICDAIHDALLLRNGILKWWWEERTEPQVSMHTGLSEDELLALTSGDVEVTEASRDEQGLYRCTIKRTATKGEIKVAAVPRERFLVHPDAITFEDSLLTGEKTQDMTRSDLIAMGYDKDKVWGLPIAEEEDEEELERRETGENRSDEATQSNQRVDYYDLYIRIDMDGDGISELRHMCFAGGLTEQHLLLDEECDEVQYASVTAIRQPHQWEGTSLFDDLRDIQQVNTVLLRQTADNLYWQNNPQPIMQSGAIENPEAVYNSEFGLPIEVRNGTDVRQAMSFNQVPFVVKDSFAMMEFMSQQGQDRTGVSDASAGLAPDALQNMTATASAMIEQAGIGQTELMVRTLAQGLKLFFSGILRLVIRHQDKPRTVRLRNEWVQFDPQHWNAGMDVTVNTGLGAGTRERDMMMMQNVLGIQERIIAQMGPNNPFVTPQNLSNTLTKLVEAAGLRTPGMYFNEPTDEEIAGYMEQLANQPNPEEMKLQAEMQAKQADMKMQMQMKQLDMQVQRDKEKAQMEADLIVEEKRLNAKAQEAQVQAELDARKEGQKLAFDREKLDREDMFKREELRAKMSIEAAKLQDADLAQSLNDEGGGVTLPKQPSTQEVLAQAMERLTQVMASQANAPKRIVRDENNDVIGVETVLQ